MGFGPFSSSSDTRSTVTNTNASVNLADGANAFAPHIAGRNNTLSVVSTDLGAIQLASQLLDRTLQAQANTTLEAIGMSRELAETKISDGANITSKTVRIAFLALAAVLAIFFILRR